MFYGDTFCQWVLGNFDGDVHYETACGHVHMFLDGDPADNNYKYCPFCGKQVTETQPTAL